MRAFDGEYKPVKVHVLVPGSSVDGERTDESFLPPADDGLVPRPVTPEQEKRLPEGKYKAGDMKFYSDGSAKYKSGDLIEYTGIKYRIGDISDRPEGGFVIYMAKRVYGND